MNWVTEKKINILIQVGLEKETELTDVPLLLDMVKGDDVGVVKLVSLPTALGYGHWVAPGVPKDRVEALRSAYVSVLKDAEFLKETEKSGMVIRSQAGAALANSVKEVAKTPQPVIARTAQILKWK